MRSVSHLGLAVMTLLAVSFFAAANVAFSGYLNSGQILLQKRRMRKKRNADAHRDVSGHGPPLYSTIVKLHTHGYAELQPATWAIIMFRKAIDVMDLAFGARSSHTTSYDNTKAANDSYGFVGASPSGNTYGQSFTLSKASIIDSWSFQGYSLLGAMENLKFAVAAFNGNSLGCELFSNEIALDFGTPWACISSLDMHLALGAGSYMAYITGEIGGANLVTLSGNNSDVSPLGGQAYYINGTTINPFAAGRQLTYQAKISPQALAVVPKPETYAKLLSALGLMDFVAKHRRKTS